MKRIVFLCSGNSILFLLFGLAFIFPIKDVRSTENFGFSGTVTIYPVLLLLYLFFYPLIYSILKKKFRWNKYSNSELHFSDEREQQIVAKATKTSYITLMSGLMLAIGLIGGIKFWSIFTHQNISIYMSNILLITLLLILSTASYYVKYWIEYRK